MPRFLEPHAYCLKKTMLKRVPECVFTSDDVEAITRETNLSPAQIKSWEDHLRFRIPAMERAAYLEKPIEVTGQTQFGGC